MSIGKLPRLRLEADLPSYITYSEHVEYVRGATRDFFEKLLPCKSLESLQIDDFDDLFDLAVVELAQNAALGRLPRLKHVRLLGRTWCDLDDVGDGVDWLHQLDRYHDLESLVPERYRDMTVIRRAMFWEDYAKQAEDDFRGAGVLFERVQLSWRVGWETGSQDRNGWMVMYPQPCALC